MKEKKLIFKKVYLEITNICNMNCSFCHGHNRKPRQMTTEEFSYILDKLKGKTKYLYYHLMGEPLTHLNLIDFIKLASERGFKSIITTNGTLLKKRGAELLSSGVYKINVSLHSFEKDDKLAHAKYIEDITSVSKTLADNGTIIDFRLWNKGVDDEKNSQTVNLLKQNIQGEWENTPRCIKIKERIYLDYGERFEWPDIDAEIKGDRYFCYGLKDQFGILVDGTVVPCCLDSNGVINLGNIFTQDLDTILNSDRAQKIVQGFRCGKASEELCKKCGYAQRFV